MSDEQKKTRSIVSEIEIDATVETVWKALTEADEIYYLGLTRERGQATLPNL